jgi:putative transposase
MARNPRVEYAGAIHHVMVRGNDRQRIFVDSADRQTLLVGFAGIVVRLEWRCHAYCLMGNHAHFLIETLEPNLSRGMQQVCCVYSRRFNQRYGRSGHLFQSRFRSVLVVSDSHLLQLCRYIVLNPLRIGMCDEAAAFEWSSYRATVGLEPRPAFLTTDWLLAQFADDVRVARGRYERFVRDGI